MLLTNGLLNESQAHSLELEAPHAQPMACDLVEMIGDVRLYGCYGSYILNNWSDAARCRPCARHAGFV